MKLSALSRRVSRYFGVALAVILLAGVGCGASGAATKKNDGIAFSGRAGNVLVTDLIEMALPEGWYFLLPEDEDETGVSLYTLARMDGLASGWVGRVPSGKGADYDWTVKAWVDSLREFNKAVESKVVSLSGKMVTIASSRTPDGLEQRDAIFSESNGYYIVSLIMDAGYFAGNPGSADTVFRSLRAVSPGKSMRHIPGLPTFACVDGSFAWYSDLDSAPGYVAFNNGAGVVIAISMAVAFSDSIEEHAATITENPFTLDFFNARIPIGSEWVDARGSGFISEDSYYLVYHFRRNGQNFLLNVVTSADAKNLDFKTVHSLPVTQDYLKRYLSF